ncbi:hypothetical protein PIB30_022909 [Stylosanthes scabra]|uniref:Uncharacterized protein n=1 Tax=Stylosanthes scabra TaxID=79078 RepID=A0ABU6Z9R2_9FABA|nr:hypothetical protein [Stylosanthes scabra]
MGTIPTSLWYYLYDSMHLPRSERINEQGDTTWEQLTSTRLDDVWDVTRTSASVAHEIAQGFRQRTHHHCGTDGAGSSDPPTGYHHMPVHTNIQFHTPAPYPQPHPFTHYQHYSHTTFEQGGLSYSSQPLPHYQHYSPSPPQLHYSPPPQQLHYSPQPQMPHYSP